MKGRVSRTWKSWTNSQKTEDAATKNVCPYCCGRVQMPSSTPGEIVGTAICSVLLLAITIPAFWVTEQWIERQSHRFLDRIVIWREPAESWNL